VGNCGLASLGRFDLLTVVFLGVFQLGLSYTLVHLRDVARCQIARCRNHRIHRTVT
jgi:hypothetical protein